MAAKGKHAAAEHVLAPGKCHAETRDRAGDLQIFSLQGYHGVIHDNLAGSDSGMAQAGNRAGKTQPCMQMGEHGLE